MNMSSNTSVIGDSVDNFTLGPINTTELFNVSDIGHQNFTDSVNVSDTGSTRNSGGLDLSPGYYGEIRVLLWKIIPPFLILFGTVGNVLTFLVILRQARKATSTTLYLCTLAVSDTLILWCGPFRNWVSNVWEIDIRFLSDNACKIQLYLTYSSAHFSSWLLVAVTMERTVSVVLPHRVKLLCTRRNAGLIIITLFLFTFGLDTVIPAIQALDGYQGQRCAPKTKEYREFRDNIWQWIDFCMAFAVPFLFLLTGNTIIVTYLYRSRADRKRMSSSQGSPGKGPRDTTGIFVLMVSLCAIFVATMTPVTVYQIYWPYLFEDILEMYKTEPQEAWNRYQYLLLVRTIVNLVSYVNAALNFVLYVFSGTKFRTQLLEMFRRKSAYSGSDPFGNRHRTSDSNKTKSTSLAGSSQHESGTEQTDDVQSNGVSKTPYRKY